MPSTGPADGPERAQAPSGNNDEPTLTVSQPETVVHNTGRSRRRELPDGDSLTLRLARCLGLR